MLYSATALRSRISGLRRAVPMGPEIAAGGWRAAVESGAARALIRGPHHKRTHQGPAYIKRGLKSPHMAPKRTINIIA